MRQNDILRLLKVSQFLRETLSSRFGSTYQHRFSLRQSVFFGFRDFYRYHPPNSDTHQISIWNLRLQLSKIVILILHIHKSKIDFSYLDQSQPIICADIAKIEDSVQIPPRIGQTSEIRLKNQIFGFFSVIHSLNYTKYLLGIIAPHEFLIAPLKLHLPKTKLRSEFPSWL